MALIVVTARSEKITARERKHAAEKIQKLEKYFNGITRIEISLQRAAEVALAELIISVKRGGQIFCKRRDKDLYAAIDLVLDKAEIQLTRHKEKVRTHRGRKGAAVADAVAGSSEAAEGEPLETYDEVIAKREFGSSSRAQKK